MHLKTIQCNEALLVFVFKLHLTSLWKQKKQYFVPTSHLLTCKRVRFLLQDFPTARIVMYAYIYIYIYISDWI